MNNNPPSKQPHQAPHKQRERDGDGSNAQSEREEEEAGEVGEEVEVDEVGEGGGRPVAEGGPIAVQGGEETGVVVAW
ncbi:hypothetical protein Vi05172_g12657 [Venturia inaequalis]|nr:hypothetical protein Vi05172_g12657 [Venturia inaequalis]